MSAQTTVNTPTRGAPRGGAYRVLVVFAPDRERVGATFALGSERLELGRAGEGPRPFTLVLDDAEVSREHAVLEPFGDGWRARDLGSRNGTFVDGERIDATVVGDGSVVRAGAHLLLVQLVSFADAQRLLTRRQGDSTLVGDGVAMSRVRQSIDAAAPLDVPVLVLGETGVGKELVAQELHARSGRPGAFVAVNCAALPENLVESELFGHARGAFTGATAVSGGLFGEADHGTLFLDEIGEMPVPMQAKLLRALATGEVRAVGETRARTVDVRVIAATNVELEAAVDDGRFRADLYARLMGRVIDVPPLRARRDDLIALAEHFLAAAGAKVRLSPDAAEALLVHRWRFNVRELEQVMRAAAPAARGAGMLDLAHLSERVQGRVAERSASLPVSPPSAPADVPLALRVRRDGAPTAAELTEVLRHFAGSVAKAAEFFGKDRKQVYRWVERLGVDAGAIRSETEE